MNDSLVIEEPKAAEKPSLVLSIGSGTYPVFLQFSTISSASLEDRIKRLIRQEVLSAPACINRKDPFSSLPPNQQKKA
ncbi:MAG: hypothetical protein IKI84_08185 [Clostridia bacterium]|nr:hypothetical protein [Clostridia bacterium]